MKTDVGIGEYAATRTPGDSLKTYALGSCVAVIFHSPASGTVGMIHIALPSSAGHSEKAARLPGYFADTGLDLLWQKLLKMGGGPGRVSARLIGGAQVLDDGGVFDIGRRNVLAARKWLWKAGIGLLKEETGGKASRTVEVFQDGRVEISSRGVTQEI